MAETAFGTLLKTGSTTITKVKSVSGGGSTVTAIETGNMDAAFTTNLVGLQRGNPLTFSIEYEKTATTGNYDICEANLLARTATVWTVTFTDTSVVTGSGFITNLSSPEGETESELTFTMEITPVTTWALTGVGA